MNILNNDYPYQTLMGIYSIKNITNGKQYIGLSRDILRRWQEHTSELMQHKHNNRYLQFAWDKYGAENFTFAILEVCPEEQLSERECYYIKALQTMSHQNGYNLTPGGEDASMGKLVIRLKDKEIFNSVTDVAKMLGKTVDTISRWCADRRNYMLLEDYNNLSKEEQEYWTNFDWKTSDHERISNAHKNILNKHRFIGSGSKNPRAYKVYCPQLDETFDYVKLAAEKYNICYTSILNCINGKVQYVGKHPITQEKLQWFKV